MLSISRPGPKAKRALFFMASDSVVLALKNKKIVEMRRIYIFKKTRQNQIMNIPFGLGVGLEAKLQDGYEHGQD